MFGIRVMKRNKQFVPQSSLVTLNKSLIQPYYDYCFPLWGNFEQSLAARVITVIAKDIFCKAWGGMPQ